MGGACKMRLWRRAGHVRPNSVVVYGRSGARLASSFPLHAVYGLRTADSSTVAVTYAAPVPTRLSSATTRPSASASARREGATTAANY